MNLRLGFNLSNIKFIYIFILSVYLATSANSQCSQNYKWAKWDKFTSNSASGTINNNIRNINITMSANYQFGSTDNIFFYEGFAQFPGTLPPNTTSPQTTWAIGPGGITSMCFSEIVSNPVLLLSSLGSSGIPVTLKFSKTYIPIFNFGNVVYINDSTIFAEEGYTVIKFPGNFDCVSIFSSTPEYYSNITWGLNPPLFSVNISGNLVACDSTILTASGASSYLWSGGKTPNSASNTFSKSGVYTLTATDQNGCTVVTSRTVEISNASTSSEINIKICEGESYSNYKTSGIYIDSFVSAKGCISIRKLTLSVLPKLSSHQVVTICEGENFETYKVSGLYSRKLKSINGCDSTSTIDLTVLPSYKSTKNINICKGSFYNFNGRILSSEGKYIDSMQTFRGCDSIQTVNLKFWRDDFLGNDTTICFADEHQLKSPNVNTIWFDNTTSDHKAILKTGTYWAKLIDSNGCELIDTIFVRFNHKSYTPNVFSPNDDGINDCFQPILSETRFLSYHFNVYDRWGNQVFSTTNPADCWNGKNSGVDCNSGVYICFVEIETKICNKIAIKKDVTLIR